MTDPVNGEQLSFTYRLLSGDGIFIVGIQFSVMIEQALPHWHSEIQFQLAAYPHRQGSADVNVGYATYGRHYGTPSGAQRMGVEAGIDTKYQPL